MASKSLEKWRNRGKTFNYRGYDVFYREQGRGEVLLCVHGFPTSSYDWVPIWPELVRRFRVIAPDMLGFGFSAKPADYHYSCCDQAVLLEELLNRLKVKRVHILAHDYGDSVTQELLARYKDRRQGEDPGPAIQSVCFLNGGLFPETHRARPIQRLLLSPLGGLVMMLMTESAFRRSLCKVFSPDHQPGDELLADYWELVRFNRGKRVAPRLLQYIPERRVNRSRWVGSMVQTAIPVRLINGPLDPVSGRHMADRYRELIPNADVVSLEGMGHYPQVEQPERVMRAYIDFMRPFLQN